MQLKVQPFKNVSYQLKKHISGKTKTYIEQSEPNQHQMLIAYNLTAIPSIKWAALTTIFSQENVDNDRSHSG